MRILNYSTPKELLKQGTTPLTQVLLRLGLFLGVSVVVYLLVWGLAVYFVGQLVRIPF